ncbi:tropomyosin A-like [Etheostoma spectabile]|uniref:tropomyosin A-like n=1 Tax=Etheostoma spectabile TaxID=54343 RepID=UPI0013AF0C1D|nr:tropomyosin A-like [Etheostoma spectabile]
MEFNTRENQPIDFYLSYLEEQVRLELKDGEATLTQCESEGRVHLIIREDLLADLLNQLQLQREGSGWGHEKELMQKEIGELKVLLAERVPSPPRETEHLRSQLVKTSNRLRKAQKDLDLQYFIAEDLKVELEQVKGEKEALKKEVESQKMELCKERQKLTVSKTNVELELGSFLEMERAQVQELKDKLRKMEEALQEQGKEAKKIRERSQSSRTARLDEALAERVPSPPRETEHLTSQLEKAQKDLDLQTFTTEALKVDLKHMKGEMQALLNIVARQKLKRRKERQILTVSKTANVMLESHLEMERDRAQELMDKLSKVEEDLLKQDEEAKEIMERSQASHRAQLERQDTNNKTLMAALEEKYDQLESERVLWQQEKTTLLEESDKSRASYVDQNEEQSFVSDCLLAALKNTEQQLESDLNQWKEDKTSLLQATESLKLTQLEKEQEWERTESTLRSQLVDLQSQIMEKPKKKKWYKKLLPG